MKSWRTTLCGFLAAVSAAIPAINAAIDGNPATVPDWSPIFPALMAAIGLMLARDAKVSSEQQGIKP
jgi:hypothetical protein